MDKKRIINRDNKESEFYYIHEFYDIITGSMTINISNSKSDFDKFV